MEPVLTFYRNALTGWIIGAVAFSAFGMLLAAAMGRAGALSRHAIANAGVSIGFWLGNTALAPAALFVALVLGNLLFAAGWPQLPAGAITALPFWGQLLLFSILYDFTEYWVHRALHTGPLWPIHAIHHSDTAVNGFTTLRVHLFEPFLVRLAVIFTMGWAGIPAEVKGAGLAISLMHNCYVHFDLDWDHGPLRWLIASPRFHRLHHVDHPSVHHRNLANIFPVWDIMFGTWAGTGRVQGDFGAAKSGVPDRDFLALWLWPFTQWAKPGKNQPAGSGGSSGT
ncbi:hypothetical protein CAP39_11365 [Sphingomonas sp. IBVSS1]|nr:hypothetical protein CAP39_11365 [Sphingomonas sp. IBVSS1]